MTKYGQDASALFGKLVFNFNLLDFWRISMEFAESLMSDCRSIMAY
jgi:hypothetical protein